MQSELRSETERGAVAAQISREIVQLHAKMFGRGPTKAKTYIQHDYVLCLLEDVFTPAERTLVRAGSTEQVHNTRRAFQDAVSEEFITIVQDATDRKVRAFMSQVNVESELSAQFFLMEPSPEAESTEDEAGSADESG